MLFVARRCATLTTFRHTVDRLTRTILAMARYDKPIALNDSMRARLS